METLEKIGEEIKKLCEADDGLSIILELAGHDSETNYTQPYLDLLEDLKALRGGLHALLDNHNDTIMALEFAVSG